MTFSQEPHFGLIMVPSSPKILQQDPPPPAKKKSLSQLYDFMLL